MKKAKSTRRKAHRASRPIKVGDIVRILKYKKDGINGYGRVAAVRMEAERPYWVVNGNMPFQGTVSDFFSADEIRLRPRRSPERCPTCGHPLEE